MEEARYDYEKQHQAVDIPSLSGLPEMVRTVASAIVGRYNSMAACGHVLFFEEGMNGPVTPDRHIILLHARYTKNLHNSCISYFLCRQQCIASDCIGSIRFALLFYSA